MMNYLKTDKTNFVIMFHIYRLKSPHFWNCGSDPQSCYGMCQRGHLHTPILPTDAAELGSETTSPSITLALQREWPLNSLLILVLILDVFGEQCLWASHETASSVGLLNSDNVSIAACPWPSASLFIPLPSASIAQVFLNLWELTIASERLLRATPAKSLPSSQDSLLEC